MISGGNVTIGVTDMERSVRFFVEKMAFKLVRRFDDRWAEVDAGGLVLALHPTKERPARGMTSIGLTVNIPIGDVVAVLENRGVVFTSPIRREHGIALASFEDPDGNAFYLCEESGH